MNVRRSPQRALGSILDTVFDTSFLVLVEGAGDMEVISRVLVDIDGPDVLVHDMKGKDDWRGKLGAIAEDQDFRDRLRSLALIRDAETNPAASLESCQGALRASDLPAPGSIGDIVEEHGRRVGIYLLPGGEEVGMLEDLMLRSGDAERVVASEDFLASLGARGFPSPRTRAKALLQSYLAGMEDSPQNLYLGMQQGVFDAHNDAFDDLRSFLVRVCQSPD